VAEKRNVSQAWNKHAMRVQLGRVCVFAAVALGGNAWGQDVAPGVQSLDRYQAEQERLRKLMESRPKAYEDKVMDPSALPAVSDTSAAPSADQEGLRSYLSETRLGTARTDSGLELRRANELGQRFAYTQETLNYGDYSLEADLRSASGDPGLIGVVGANPEKSSARITLRSIGFPITEKVFADTSLGDISSEVTTALGRSYRLSLGTSTVRGASTRIFDADSDTRAGAGVRGTLTGGPYSGFVRTEGELAWLGHSRRVGTNGSVGIQLSRATGVPAFTLTAPVGISTANVSSVALAAGYGSTQLADGGHSGRAIYMRSDTSGAGIGSAQGLFLEGSLRLDNLRHEFGAYQADPGLRYGDYLLQSDNRGAYWRVDASSMRLSWGLGLDVEELNPRRTGSQLNRLNIGLSANAQYRIDRNRFVGGNFSFRDSRYRVDGASDLREAVGEGTRNYYASGFYETRLAPGWGRTRIRGTVRRNVELVTNGLPASGEEVEWEQDWITGRFETQRPELTTTLGVARDRSAGLTDTSPTAGVNFRVWLQPNWYVGGNLRFTSRQGNLATSRGLSGTLDSEMTLGNGWLAGATVSLNQAVVDTSAAGLTGPTVSRSNDKTAEIYLRWEGTRGSGFQGAGLRAPGTVGAGGLGGVVFFDGNRDGEQQLDENGVPNVEVTLDGRYRIKTDRNGRFDFPLVGTGRHQLTLTLETVPLPWGAASDRAVVVEVPLRGQVTARIPVVRVGD
jgi:hypothetical protein